MDTNLSVERLAGTLVRENLKRKSFFVATSSAHDLARLTTQFEGMGCHVEPLLDGSGLNVTMAEAQVALSTAVLIGHGNEDVHFIQVMEHQEASQLATKEALDVGKLTNAGFRTLVAAAWFREETKSAGLLYVAAWQDGEVKILLSHGGRSASSHELYVWGSQLKSEGVTTLQLLDFCDRLILT